MNRPRLLDLFCGAGGAAMGYHRAGFDVVGVDIEPQPHYPFEFVQADAMELLSRIARQNADWWYLGRHGTFDAIHASPPCQDHMRSRMRDQREHGTRYLLAATRELLQAQPAPWVIENVPGAAMRVDLELCGCMFDLDVMRTRWFETSWRAFDLRPACHHPNPIVNPMRTRHGSWYRKHGRIPTRAEVATAMGIDWMRGEEIKQAIPPPYTEHIGRQLLDVLERAA